MYKNWVAWPATESNKQDILYSLILSRLNASEMGKNKIFILKEKCAKKNGYVAKTIINQSYLTMRQCILLAFLETRFKSFTYFQLWLFLSFSLTLIFILCLCLAMMYGRHWSSFCLTWILLGCANCVYWK